MGVDEENLWRAVNFPFIKLTVYTKVSCWEHHDVEVNAGIGERASGCPTSLTFRCGELSRRELRRVKHSFVNELYTSIQLKKSIAATTD